MTSYVTPKKNTAFVFYIGLTSQGNTKTLQANPTLASGDVKVAIDDGAPANIATLPVVDADFTRRVKVGLSANEMNGDNITVIFADATGDEWCDLVISIQTSARQVDDLAYPATSGRSLTVAATGEVDANLITWQGETPNSLISGRVDVNVGANIVEEARVDGAITQAGQTTSFTTNLSETQDDKYIGWRFVYTGVGANNAVTRIVEAYNGTTKAITLNRALPATTTLGHSFVLWSDEVLTQAGANAAADTALSDIHLDHLLANTYDPASKPGAADALLNELVGNDAGVAQFTANALELAPGGGNGTVGAIEFTYTVDDGSLPIAGATVWISTDLAGNNAIFSGVTDAFGVLRNSATSAKPFLDPGTYYFWVQKSGYAFTNPDTETVS